MTAATRRRNLTPELRVILQVYNYALKNTYVRGSCKLHAPHSQSGFYVPQL